MNALLLVVVLQGVTLLVPSVAIWLKHFCCFVLTFTLHVHAPIKETKVSRAVRVWVLSVVIVAQGLSFLGL